MKICEFPFEIFHLKHSRERELQLPAYLSFFKNTGKGVGLEVT
jgi:hypothetical protein